MGKALRDHGKLFLSVSGPLRDPDQVRIINQGVGESIRTEHSFIRTPLAP